MATEKHRRAFISYSRVNKEFATKLTKGLRSAGFPVWFDQLDIPTGARWDDEVEKALRECSIFMVILTPASIASENVKDEIGYAIDHGKRILPVLLEDCDVPLRLRRFQYVDFTTKSFEEGFESAKELLGDLVEEVSVPVPVGAKTPVVEAQIEQKAEREDKAEAERKAKEKAKPAPAMSAVMKAETVSADATQKKPVSKGLIIGIVAVVVLVIAGIGFSALSNLRNPPATEAPVVEIPTAGPITLNTLSASEINKLGESTMSLWALASDKYPDTLDEMINNHTPFEVENSTLEPLMLHGGGICATTQAILEENLLHIENTFEFNGQTISDSKIAPYDFKSVDGAPCREYFVILINWETNSKHTVGFTHNVTTSYNNGEGDVPPSSITYEWIISTP